MTDNTSPLSPTAPSSADAPLRKKKALPESSLSAPLDTAPPAEQAKPRTPKAASSKKTAEQQVANATPRADAPAKAAKPAKAFAPKFQASKDVPSKDASSKAAPAKPATPKDMTLEEPANALPPVTLEDLSPAMQRACANAKFQKLMPVQERALPYLLQGRDLMVQSRTGSGKTATYLLPLIDRLDPKKKGVQALVLVPTRELASQVEHEARTLFGGSPFNVAAVYGGIGYGKQMDALRQGVSLVVGTPGRVLDHLLRRTLILDDVISLIFDEADRMLSIGFYPDMKEIQRYLPKKERHAMLFSATYPPHVLKLSSEFLHEPELLSLSTSHVHVAEVQHMFCQCKSMDKDRTLLRILEVENPTSAIIFCNTKANVHFITAVLQGFGFNADELSADLSQSRREDVLGRLRRGAIRFLVATDVAARGIDIPELSHVILYEPPDDRESYIHRAGRTGRAGAAGVVISLVDIMQKLELKRIAQYFKIPLEEHIAPSDEEVSNAVSLRATAQMEARFRQLTGLERERVLRFIPLVTEMAADPEQTGLLAMILDDVYQKGLNPRGIVQSAKAAEILAAGPPRQGRGRPDRGPRRSGGAPAGNAGGRFERRPARDESAENRPSAPPRPGHRKGRPFGDEAPRPEGAFRGKHPFRSKPEGHGE